MKGMGHVACVRQKGYAREILIGKTVDKRKLRRRRLKKVRLFKGIC
jgi:hypothetical protein